MLHRILAIAVTALVLFACSEKTTTTPVDPVVEVKFDNVEYLKAKIDGVAYTGTPSAPIITPKGAGLIDISFNSTNSAGLVTLFATIADTGKGDYVLGTGGNQTLGLVQSAVSYTTRDGATATLSVDKIDMTLKRMKGHFSGTVKSASGESKVLTDGTFEVKWM